MFNLKRNIKEKFWKWIFFFLAFISVTILALISLFLFLEAFPIFKSVGFFEFLFGKFWYPTYDPPAFGILPMIVASISVTILSSIFAIPFGLLTAIYISEVAQKRIKEIIKPIIELSASIPSVVIGFFGMVVVAPWLQAKFDIPTGLNIFNASLMLAVMAIPTICSISEDALNAVPFEYREASFALGSTKWETIWHVIVPAALPGITIASILGIGRVMGETMVVLMVTGGAAMIPHSIFDPARPLPASIAAEMGEAPFRSLHYHALFGCGLVLFFMTLFFNILAEFVRNRFRTKGAGTL